MEWVTTTLFSKDVAQETLLAFARAYQADELGITRNAVSLAKHRIVGRIRELQQEFERTE
jgi:uncharacterized protein involved in exopolysaccharide biosynthesis